MKIKWYGHASFLMTSEQGVKIITDPYEPGGFDGAITYGKITDTPDIVLISHDHGDHNYIGGIPEGHQVINKSGTHHYHNIEFSGISTYHDTSQGKERGNNIIFIFSLDGIRVCHLGDLGHFLSKQELTKIGPVDLLLTPVGGTYTIDPTVATQVVSDLNPKITIPMHYKTQKCAFPLNEVDDFMVGKERVKRLKESEVEIKKDNLPPAMEIIVLSHAL